MATCLQINIIMSHITFALKQERWTLSQAFYDCRKWCNYIHCRQKNSAVEWVLYLRERYNRINWGSHRRGVSSNRRKIVKLWNQYIALYCWYFRILIFKSRARIHPFLSHFMQNGHPTRPFLFKLPKILVIFKWASVTWPIGTIFTGSPLEMMNLIF